MCTVGAAGPEKLAWICVVDTWGKGWHTMIVRCEITTHRWCGLLSCAVMMGSSCSRGQSTQDRNRAECMRSCHNDLLIRYTWQFYPSMQQARISAVLLVWWLPYSCFLSVCVCVCRCLLKAAPCEWELPFYMDQQVYYMNSSSFVYKMGERCNELHYKPVPQPLPKLPLIHWLFMSWQHQLYIHVCVPA